MNATINLTPAQVLLAAAAHLEAHPEQWGTECWVDPRTGQRCSGGQVALVIEPDDPDGDPFWLPEEQGARQLALDAIALFEAHVEPEVLDRIGPDGLGGNPLIGVWNDKIARSAAHVAATMRAAAEAAR